MRLCKKTSLGLAAALVCAAGMWLYVDHIMVPFQRADAEAHGRPRGNLSDLYPRWLGARELLLHHRNPYSPEITAEIQVGYYGRALDPNRSADPHDQQGFAYPLYVAFLLWPTLWMPFAWVSAGFKCALWILTAATVWLWLRVLGWKLTPSALLMAVVLMLGCFPVVQGIKLQQLTLVVAALMAAACALLVSGHRMSSGALLALATIKPQLVAPLLAVLLVWAASEWGQRRKLVFGFVLALGLLVGAAQILQPGWIGDFLAATREYRHYAGGLSMLQVLLGETWGRIASVMAAAAVAVVAWQFRREEAGSTPFALMIALCLAVTVIIIPMFAPYNYILLLPAILILCRDWRLLWSAGNLAKAGLLAAAASIAWPWAAAIGLVGISLFVPALQVQRLWWLPLYTSVTIPIPILCLVPLGFRLARALRREATALRVQAPVL